MVPCVGPSLVVLGSFKGQIETRRPQSLTGPKPRGDLHFPRRNPTRDQRGIEDSGPKVNHNQNPVLKWSYSQNHASRIQEAGYPQLFMVGIVPYQPSPTQVLIVTQVTACNSYLRSSLKPIVQPRSGYAVKCRMDPLQMVFVSFALSCGNTPHRVPQPKYLPPTSESQSQPSKVESTQNPSSESSPQFSTGLSLHSARIESLRIVFGFLLEAVIHVGGHQPRPWGHVSRENPPTGNGPQEKTRLVAVSKNIPEAHDAGGLLETLVVV